MHAQNMDIQKTLRKFKIEVDREIEKQLNIAIADAGKNNTLTADALRHAKRIALAGGKRIRGALLYCGYMGAGGRDKKKIIKAAAAVELAHLFILVHDDIIDHGILRHGKETLHKKFSQKKYTRLSGDDALHFGQSLAIIVGDMFYAILNKMILEAGFQQEATIRGLLQIQKVAMTTAIGQGQDIAIGRAEKTTIQDVFTMYENKTARYTFEGPLRIGMMFAECNNKKLFDQLSLYTLPIGIAFQIQDDILGIFSSEKKLGKSVASDIEEGKNTLMVLKALELSSPEQKKRMGSILGKKKLSEKEIADFKKILIETGAVDYAQKIADKCMIDAKKQIEKSFLPTETKYFLLGLIRYLKNREL